MYVDFHFNKIPLKEKSQLIKRIYKMLENDEVTTTNYQYFHMYSSINSLNFLCDIIWVPSQLNDIDTVELNFQQNPFKGKKSID
jgi:hypothetical protein